MSKQVQLIRSKKNSIKRFILTIHHYNQIKRMSKSNEVRSIFVFLSVIIDDPTIVRTSKQVSLIRSKRIRTIRLILIILQMFFIITSNAGITGKLLMINRRDNLKYILFLFFVSVIIDDPTIIRTSSRFH